MKMRMGGIRLLIGWLGSSEKKKKKRYRKKNSVCSERTHI